MTTRDSTELAANILAMCKKIDPAFWRLTDEQRRDMAQGWGYIFARHPYPAEIYFDAVAIFYETTSDRRPGPADILDACKVAIKRWETHPTKRKVLRRWREERRERLDREIADGTMARRLGITGGGGES